MQLLSLGLFVFALDRVAYEELQRKSAWIWAANNRVGAAPAMQFMGRGDDGITLPGRIALELGQSFDAIDELRAMGDEGGAWPLVDGSGRVLGEWSIVSLDATERAWFADGAPRRGSFSLELKRVDDSPLGSPTSVTG